MIFIDTHCHLYLEDFAEDIVEILQKADNEGVKKFYLPAIDSATMPALLGLVKRFPGKCIAMAGLHPCSVKANYKEELKLVEKSLASGNFAAVGEIGLDFYWDRTFEKDQYEAMNMQIEWAIQYNLPIVIHSRESIEQTISVVREKQDGNLKGVFHCFTENYEYAKQIIDLGFYMGIGGVITFKNSKLPEVVSRIGLDHIVLETDAPYLTPAPFRGKRNESSYIKYIAEKLAAVMSISKEEVARITTANAEKIFGR
ncbi:MAG: TatD family hydrolase [Bacteroidetes bacterium]|nr:TatD family hydrolase [Bacteroidota bacterium]